MMRNVSVLVVPLLVLLMLGDILSFAPPRPMMLARQASLSARFMFSAGDDKSSPTTTAAPPALQTVDETAPSTATTASISDTSLSSGSTNVVRDMNTGEVREVKWKDPAMLANTNPLLMNWWAYVLFGAVPAVLLLNDVFHFLPKDYRL